MERSARPSQNMLLHERVTISEESRTQFPVFNRLQAPEIGQQVELSSMCRDELWREARSVFNNLYEQRDANTKEILQCEQADAHEYWMALELYKHKKYASLSTPPLPTPKQTIQLLPKPEHENAIALLDSAMNGASNQSETSGSADDNEEFRQANIMPYFTVFSKSITCASPKHVKSKKRSHDGSLRSALHMRVTPPVPMHGEALPSLEYEPPSPSQLIIPTIRMPPVIPLPHATTTVVLTSNFSVKDQPVMTHVPYLGEGTNFADIAKLGFNTVKIRNFGGEAIEVGIFYLFRKYWGAAITKKYGALHGLYNKPRVERVGDESDASDSDDDEDSDDIENKRFVQYLRKTSPLLSVLKSMFHMERNEVRAIIHVYNEAVENLKYGNITVAASPAEISTLGTPAFLQLVLNRHKHLYSSTPYRSDYVKDTIDATDITSNMREIFCPRCYVFDCNRHGSQSNIRYHRTNPATYNANAIAEYLCKDVTKRDRKLALASNVKDLSNKGIDEFIRIETEELQRVVEASSLLSDAINRSDIALCVLLTESHGMDAEAIATLLKVPVDKIRAIFDELKGFVIQRERKFLHNGRHTKSVEASIAAKREQEIDGRKLEKKIRSLSDDDDSSDDEYSPCEHEGPCTAVNCSCVRRYGYCERYCPCAITCDRLFMGCKCQSKCNMNSCSCLSAGRECDPNLCFTCGACIHPTAFSSDGMPLEDVGCRNMQVTRGQGKRISLGRSGIHGWGIFLREPAKRGDLITEYLGEIISSDESNRRGFVYDKKDCTFLFQMGSEFTADGIRKGNKAKYINHSSNPNCEAKTVQVHRENRIVIQALKDISPGEELTFRYALQGDNLPDWMKK